MRTREDVIRHFTYVPPRSETADAAKAVHRAIVEVEEYVNRGFCCAGWEDEVQGTRTHSLWDAHIRTCAITIFDTLPEVPDRTAALRTLWLARGLGHAWLKLEVTPDVDRSFSLLFDAVLVRLAEVRIQAIGAIVMATP